MSHFAHDWTGIPNFNLTGLSWERGAEEVGRTKLSPRLIRFTNHWNVHVAVRPWTHLDWTMNSGH
jgi:hypothetical protein